MLSQLKNVEVWFQRASNVVRKLKTGDADLGIVGYDMLREYGEVPTYGIFENVNSLSELAARPFSTEERPLCVVTGYTYFGKSFLQEHGFKHVQLTTVDGALEATPTVGTAEAIVDLVSSGTSLRENSLKEISGGAILSSQLSVLSSYFCG